MGVYNSYGIQAQLHKDVEPEPVSFAQFVMIVQFLHQ